MASYKQYEASEFPLSRCVDLKKGRKIYVVFSTFGTREADLIFNKIRLLVSEAGDFLDGIFLSHRRVDESSPETTEDMARKAWDGIEIVICNSLVVPDMGHEKGKGADMRRTLFHINKIMSRIVPPEDVIIVFLDADVVPEYFGTHFLLGLGGAVLEGNDFSKAGFWRAMGRVKKYVAQPLFSVIQHDRLDILTRLSYPLSGEVAGTLDFFNSVNFWQIYGVETGINVDTCMGDYSIADVNLGLYDHEHHGDVSIQKMSFGIIRTYLMKLQQYGLLELKNGATISNEFRAEYIDDKGERKNMYFDLTEKKYEPLRSLFGI